MDDFPNLDIIHYWPASDTNESLNSDYLQILTNVEFDDIIHQILISFLFGS